MNETTGDLGPPPPTPEEAAAIRIRRRSRFYKVVGIWLMVCVGLIVEKILNLGSVEGGLWDGLKACAFATLFMMPVLVVLAVVGAAIGTFKKCRRYRLLLTFALPAIPVLMIVGAALYGRCFPEKKFQRLTGVELPGDARIDRYVLDSGWSPVHDTSCTFEITCPAEQTERLLDAMKMRKLPLTTGLAGHRGGPSRGWTVAEEWNQRRDSDKGSIQSEFIQAETDATHTRLQVTWGTI